ncbi:unnamed protein product [Somion occarium]|uniref:Uncharacterized protein n=1 Tax=Somion occarium TaxID=3059160 RepID=A0ABP1EE87_9APHY
MDQIQANSSASVSSAAVNTESPQRDAKAGTIASYVIVGFVGVWIWDALLSITSEICMLRKHRFPALPDVVYVIARVTTGGYLTAMLILAVTHFDCYVLTKIADWFGALALPCNSLLFLLRVRGVFYQSHKIFAMFCVLWLFTLGSLAGPFTIKAINDHSPHCLLDVQSLSAFAFVAVVVFDTVVFVAISVRVVTYIGWADSWQGQMKSFISGKGLGHISRALLQTGQLYYLASVGVTIFSVVILFVPSIPSVIRGTMTIPGIAIQNAMACRVFRLLRRGAIYEQPPSLPLSDTELHLSIQFAARSSLSDTGTLSMDAS